MSPVQQPPRGGEAVQVALIEAAITLFAERGPAVVSVREIAKRAGVNHGLVHRHFGSKEGLLAAVLQLLAEGLSAELARTRGPGVGPRAFRAARKHSAYWRILAHSLLQGVRPVELQARFPVVTQLIAAQAARGQGRPTPQLDPRAVAAVGVAMGLGWLMFEPFVLAASGLEKAPLKERYRAILAVWRAMAQGLQPKE
jgi:TetR/AcrR family transcriptional regulator, repressor for neighboring sulfatase